MGSYHNFCKILVCIILSPYFQLSEGCSELFSSSGDFYGSYGILTLHQVQLQTYINVDIQLSVAARLPNNNPGKISLLNTNVYDDLKNGRDLRYRIDFSVQNPLPVVTSVFLNNQQLCSGSPARGIFVSTIKLSHRYTLDVNIPQYVVTRAPWEYFNTQSTSNVYYQPVTNAPVRPTYTNTPARPTYTNPPAPTYTNPPAPIRTRPPQTTAKTSISDRDSGNILQEINSKCGVPSYKAPTSTGLVYNGKTAVKGQFPWLASYIHNGGDFNGFICGGSLVSKKVVITAAHCVHDKNENIIRKAEEAFFYLGKYYLQTHVDERDYIFSSTQILMVHSDWDAFSKSFDADIAVAVLTKTVEFTNNIKPICIWTQTSNINDVVNQKGIIVGYGKTEKLSSASDKPYYADLTIVSDATCLRQPGFNEITSVRTFCAGDRDGRGPCSGDSGGGFLVKSNNKWYLRGIISSSLVDPETLLCDTNNYAVFTDTAKYTSWITQHIETYG